MTQRKNGPAPRFFKTCVVCGETKPRRQNFTYSRHYADGHDDTCKACRKAKPRKPTKSKPIPPFNVWNLKAI